MIKLPPSPEGPAVYVISEKPAEAALQNLIEAGLGALRAGPCTLETILCGPTTSPRDREQILEFLQDTYNARGAFVPGHSAEFFDPEHAGYDVVDPSCERLGEVGIIARTTGSLRAIAPRLDAAIRASDLILPAQTSEVLIFGAGPDARALAAALSHHLTTARPAKVTLASTDAAGLNMARQRLTADLPENRLEIRHLDQPAEYDRQLALLPPGSAVIRAHGPHEVDLGASGSATLFPVNGVIWDLMRPFSQSRMLAAAVPQRKAARLKLADTRTYECERNMALLEAMFGTDASDSDLARLRKALTRPAE